MLRLHSAVAAALGLTVGLLAGCGVGGPAREPDGQVAARVNDGDITVHQVQHAVDRLRVPVEPELAARRALDQLVEQELAAQAARDKGLDREAAVVQGLEAARREVLARAWQDRLASAATQPSSDEIDRYYDDHPALFAKRRLYMLQEFFVEGGPAERERVARLAAEARDAKALEDALTQARLRFRSRQFVQAAEDLPLPLVEPMAQLEPGQSLLLPQGAIRVYTVLQAQLAPVDRRLASDAIAAFLLTERKRKAVAEGMKSVRGAARVEYRGNFARAASASASAAR